LAVWNSIQDILHQVDKASRIQIVRLRTSDRERIVGMFFSFEIGKLMRPEI
jgi:hypothetical protein